MPIGLGTKSVGSRLDKRGCATSWSGLHREEGKRERAEIVCKINGRLCDDTSVLRSRVPGSADMCVGVAC